MVNKVRCVADEVVEQLVYLRAADGFNALVYSEVICSLDEKNV